MTLQRKSHQQAESNSANLLFDVVAPLLTAVSTIYLTARADGPGELLLGGIILLSLVVGVFSNEFPQPDRRWLTAIVLVIAIPAALTWLIFDTEAMLYGLSAVCLTTLGLSILWVVYVRTHRERP